MKKLLSLALAAALLLACAAGAFAEDSRGFASPEGYTLERVVILSRHNLRAPLSSNGSVPVDLTPHQWIDWTAGSSELTMKGGLLEVSIGQYFRKWLANEGLIAENAIPAEGEVRFFARDKQRCLATAHSFAAGMLPTANTVVEYPGDDFGLSDFLKPALHFYSEDYAADMTAQAAAFGGDAGFEGLAEQTRPVIKLIMDTVDMQDSEIYQGGQYGDLMTDPSGYKIEENAEPDITGAIKVASQVADALILQYYELQDPVQAAFGHELSEEDWKSIGDFMSTYLRMRHGIPDIAVNISNPLLKELESELKNDTRKLTFFCAHDVTVLSTLSALGAEPYTLPNTIEPITPISVKLMFERLRDTDGKAWYRVSLVYPSVDQIRGLESVRPDHPPMIYDVSFENVEVSADGLISEADLFALFEEKISAFDALSEEYTVELAPAA